MNQFPAGLWILGFGGHARSVGDIALACGITQLIFFDENAQKGENFLGFPVLKTWNSLLPERWAVFPAAGDNLRRLAQCSNAENNYWPLATLIAPTATLGQGCTIGAGTFIGQHAHIGPMAKIGKSCIINTAAIIEHEVEIGNYSHISVNATIAGRSQIGCQTFIGAGATIIDCIQVTDNVILGAGACAIRNISEPGIHIGVPARKKYR